MRNAEAAPRTFKRLSHGTPKGCPRPLSPTRIIKFVQASAQPHRRAIRCYAFASGRRCGLRLGRNGCVAGGRSRYRAARKADGQVRAQGRNVFPQRLRLRSRSQRLCLPRRQGAEEIPSQLLEAAGRPDEGGTLLYFAKKHDWGAWALKPKCCPNMPARKIPRSIYEATRDKARAIANTEACAVSRGERKKVEMLFAHQKRILGLGRLRLRGPSGAKDEFLLPPKSAETGEAHPPPRADLRHMRRSGPVLPDRFPVDKETAQ
jgi:Transposase DDE domain